MLVLLLVCHVRLPIWGRDAGSGEHGPSVKPSGLVLKITCTKVPKWGYHPRRRHTARGGMNRGSHAVLKTSHCTCALVVP